MASRRSSSASVTDAPMESNARTETVPIVTAVAEPASVAGSAEPASAPVDPFASLRPGKGWTLVERRDGDRPLPLLVHARGVEEAWRAWRSANPTEDPRSFVSALERACGEQAVDLRPLSVLRIRCR